MTRTEMMTRLSIVEESFNLETGGCFLTPGIPVDRKTLKIKVGETIELRRPDGHVIKTMIEGLMMVCRTPEAPPIPIALPKRFRKEDIPVGTEIWIEMEGRQDWPNGSPATD